MGRGRDLPCLLSRQQPPSDLSEHGDYVEFDMLLASAFRKHDLDCFGWSLMPNHWHGVVRCPQAGLSRFMKDVNHRMRCGSIDVGRTAHLFANRFGAVLQTTERQFLGMLRYVVRNPVEAGICASPYDARWTSFAATQASRARPITCASIRSSSALAGTTTLLAAATSSSSSASRLSERARTLPSLRAAGSSSRCDRWPIAPPGEP